MDLAYDQLQATRASIDQDQASANPESPATTSAASDKPTPTSTNIDRAAERLETGIESAFSKLSTRAAQAQTAFASANKNSRWAPALGGLWSKAKQQASVALEEAGKDLKAVRSEVGDLWGSATTSSDVEKYKLDESTSGKRATTDVKKTDSASSSSDALASSLETITAAPTDGKPKGTKNMLAMLTKKAQLYIDELDKDLEVVENTAGSYLAQFTTDVSAYLKEAVSVAPPLLSSGGASRDGGAAGEPEVLFNVPEDIRNQIYSTRLDAQLHALHTSPEPYLEPRPTDDPAFAPFAGQFDIANQTDQIAADLDKYPLLRTLMERLVPNEVAYDEFWLRYYFMREMITSQEEKRKALLQKAAALSENKDGEAFKWDDDDDDDDEEETEETKTTAKSSTTTAESSPKAGKKGASAVTSSRPSSESSYDLVSQNASTLDLPSHGAAATTAATAAAAGKVEEDAEAEENAVKDAAATPKAAGKEKAKVEEEESESDDDWE